MFLIMSGIGNSWRCGQTCHTAKDRMVKPRWMVEWWNHGGWSTACPSRDNLRGSIICRKAMSENLKPSTWSSEAEWRIACAREQDISNKVYYVKKGKFMKAWSYLPVAEPKIEWWNGGVLDSEDMIDSLRFSNRFFGRCEAFSHGHQENRHGRINPAAVSLGSY